MWMVVGGYNETPFAIYFIAPVIVNDVRIAWFAYARHNPSKPLVALAD